MLRVQRRLTTLLPACADERRDLGLVYLRTGEPVRALEMLEPFVADCPRDQAEALKPSLKAARRMIAEWN
jgi:regulator of sirC expression with transglutaminase-like and TPR domain